MTEEKVDLEHPNSAPETQVAGEEDVATADISASAAYLAALEGQLVELKDEALRATAEAQNIRRRAERDVEQAHRFALEKFVHALLPILDSLERGLLAVAQDETQKASYEGMQLTYKMFEDTLVKFHVQPVMPEGEPFNPELHQAMVMQENKEVEPNSVLSVLQKGYTLHGRLIRPAMVVVSK